MTEKNTAPEAKPTKAAPVRRENFTVSISPELFAALKTHRFSLELDRPEFYRHVFNEYAKSVGITDVSA